MIGTEWSSTKTRPASSMWTECWCGVTSDVFMAFYDKERDCWKLEDGSSVVFGSHTRDWDRWRPAAPAERERTTIDLGLYAELKTVIAQYGYREVEKAMNKLRREYE